MEILKIYLLFWIFAILGWIMEVIVCSISDGKFANRGFLIGPYCPIYGFGGVIMLFLKDITHNPFLCFILCMISCSILEYFTSFLMELLFKVRWWDYSNDKFNINGRICLRNALAFGALGLILLRYVLPIFDNFLDNLNNNIIYIASIIVFIITTIDLIISYKAMNKIKNIINKNINKFKNIDATNTIKKIIKNNLNISYLEKRIINVYDIVNKFNKKRNYLSLLIIVISFLILGIILGYIYKNYNIIYLSISIGVLLSFLIKERKDKYENNGRRK